MKKGKINQTKMNIGLLVLCGNLCQNVKWISSYLAHDLPVNFLCCECKVFRFPVEVSARSDGLTRKTINGLPEFSRKMFRNST